MQRRDIPAFTEIVSGSFAGLDIEDQHGRKVSPAACMRVKDIRNTLDRLKSCKSRTERD